MEIINQIIQVFRQGLPCLFHLATGYYCPGCGGTRAVKFLLHGELGKSLLYHPLVLYMVLVVLVETLGWAASKIWKNPKLHIRHYELLTYIGIAIIFVNWGWKNYMLVVKGVALLPF